MSSEESERVKKHKRRRMKDGYKNISFMVSPEEFKMIKQARKKYKMSTRELMIYFVSGLRDNDMAENLGFIHDINYHPNDDKYYQRLHDEAGRAHYFLGKKDYILLEYLTVDRKKVKIIKEFDTDEEAYDFEETYVTKKRIDIFYKVKSNLNWYITYF